MCNSKLPPNYHFCFLSKSYLCVRGQDIPYHRGRIRTTTNLEHVYMSLTCKTVLSPTPLSFHMYLLEGKGCRSHVGGTHMHQQVAPKYVYMQLTCRISRRTHLRRACSLKHFWGPRKKKVHAPHFLGKNLKKRPSQTFSGGFLGQRRGPKWPV